MGIGLRAHGCYVTRWFQLQCRECSTDAGLCPSPEVTLIDKGLFEHDMSQALPKGGKGGCNIDKIVFLKVVGPDVQCKTVSITDLLDKLKRQTGERAFKQREGHKVGQSGDVPGHCSEISVARKGDEFQAVHGHDNIRNSVKVIFRTVKQDQVFAAGELGWQAREEVIVEMEDLERGGKLGDGGG